MKIIRIFADQLFAFHYENEADNEYNRLMDLWTDVAYLQAFAKKNKVSNVYEYAIKLDDNCFVITGEAIKMSQKMQEHPATNNELKKLKSARAFLNKNGVCDEDSFFELLSERQ